MSEQLAPTKAVTAAPFQIPNQSELTLFAPDLQLLESNHVVGFNSRHLSSRPFSLLRSQLVKRMKARGHQLVGVTSPAPGAGKSFLTANLAATLSRLPNHFIHVFDLDVRRASLAANFGLMGEVGLERFLSGETDDLKRIGRHVEGTNLALYPCYSSDYETMPLLASDRFAAFIASLRTLPSDHLILFDMPPVFANDDAMVVASQIDAYLMVIEQGRNSQKQVMDAIRLLDPSECIGSVLNRYDGGVGDPYGYNYGAYGKYTDYFSKGD
ncbi:Mrp family chromosome partitioning ATPase [Sphingobium xanthum]|uniref:CpsD/CapB family tyrosine-protein kinase n=1 Tax=Sphingobium xanthum TaxID=1387165 RepID=UPI001C8B9A5F